MTPELMFATREQLEWPRDRVARLLGCSIGLVRRWETGVVPIPPEVGEWMIGVGQWGQSLPQPPNNWRTRSARDHDETVVRTYAACGANAATTLTTPQEDDMGTNRRDRPGFIDEAIEETIDRHIDREQDEQGALHEAVENNLKEMRSLSELESALHKRLDSMDKRIYENTRVMREIACHLRNAPWVVQTPEELPF